MNTVIKLLFSLFTLSNFICIAQDTIELISPKKDWVTFIQKLKSVSSIDTFLETGTYLGDTTFKASQVLQTVHSIEINNKFYQDAVERFKDNPNIFIHQGDSEKLFPVLLPLLVEQRKKILFWLDGHFMEGASMGNNFTPILQELVSIKNNNIKESIILIDDIRLFGTLLNNKRLLRAGDANYPMLQDVTSMLTDMNYNFAIVGDVLLAYDASTELSFSPVINACTKSRLYDGKNFDTLTILEAENTIANAHGQELEALKKIYTDFSLPWKWVNRSPHYNLWYGLVLQNQGSHENASKQLEEAINLGYDHWRIYWYLAKSLYQIQDFCGTKLALEVVLKNAPQFKPAQELKVLLHNACDEKMLTNIVFH